VRYLSLLFFVVPFVELWVLLRVGDLIGFWPTMGLVVSTAMLGGYLAKREGRRTLAEWQKAFAEMRMPEEGLTSGVLVLVGAVLLVSPGVLGDVVGLTLLIPVTRKWVAKGISRWIDGRIAQGGAPGIFTVQMHGPSGSFVHTEFVDARGVVVEEHRAAPRAGVIEAEVVSSTTRELPSGKS
jgi:UPF0716 protein FxsA